MTSKAKTANEPTPAPTYDSRVGQTIQFTFTKNRKEYAVSHAFKPLEEERYFAFQEQAEGLAARFKSISTAIYDPKETLWLDLIESVSGYAEKPDFRDAVPIQHRIQVIAPLIDVFFPDVETSESSDLFDIDEVITVEFHAQQNDDLNIGLSHSFRPETKSQLDAFLAIEANQPIPNQIASAVKQSKAEKLVKLGKELLVSTTGYADGSAVPPWHLAATTQSFFLRQIASASK